MIARQRHARQHGHAQPGLDQGQHANNVVGFIVNGGASLEVGNGIIDQARLPLCFDTLTILWSASSSHAMQSRPDHGCSRRNANL